MNNQPIMKIDLYRVKRWYKNDLLHREDGPAIEWNNGNKEWYLNGLLHREDGPAAEYENGHKEWWIHGKRHREDGPAFIDWNGDKEWFVNNIFISNIKIIFLVMISEKD